METGHPSTRAVNSGRKLGWWKLGLKDTNVKGNWPRPRTVKSVLKAEDMTIDRYWKYWKSLKIAEQLLSVELLSIFWMTRSEN